MNVPLPLFGWICTPASGDPFFRSVEGVLEAALGHPVVALQAAHLPLDGPVATPVAELSPLLGAASLASPPCICERAGMLQHIQFSRRAVSAIEPSGAGWVVTNPPYGLRVSHGKDLRDLYSQFGHVLRRRCLGWHVAILGNDLRLFGQLGLDLDTSFGMVNGGGKVRLARGVVKAG